MDTHVWVFHPATGNHWQCPVGFLDDARAVGWVESEAPVEHNPATAERTAFLAAFAAEQAETTPTKAARRGESE